MILARASLYTTHRAWYRVRKSRPALPCEAIAIRLVDHVQQQPALCLRHSRQHIRQQIHPVTDEQLRSMQRLTTSGA